MTVPSHVAHVWVDDFFVAVERRADATLASRPVVIGGAADSPGRVVAASVEAMACGVVPGVLLSDAADLCPDAAFLPGRLDRVLDAASLVDEAIRKVAGPVEWLAIDEAVLDLAQLDRARARRVAENIRAAVGELGHAAAVGVADTRTAARVAARMARPQGILVVLPGYDGRFLSGLAPACLGELDQAALQVLAEAGVSTLGRLAALTSQDLVTLLGRGGPQLARRAAGDDARPVQPSPRPLRLSRARHFTAAVPAAEIVRAGEELLEALARALAHFGCVARALSIRVEGARGTSVSRTFDLEPPAGHMEGLQRAAAPLLTLLSTLPDLRAIAVSASQLCRTREQLPLFDDVRARSGVGLRIAGRRRSARGPLLHW